MKMIQRYLADDGREYSTAEEALNADRRYQLDAIYAKSPLGYTAVDGYGRTVPVEAIVAWIQGNPELVAELANWLSVKVD